MNRPLGCRNDLKVPTGLLSSGWKIISIKDRNGGGDLTLHSRHLPPFHSWSRDVHLLHVSASTGLRLISVY